MAYVFQYQNVLKEFPSWRKRKLRKIKRYVAFNVFYYRSSLWLHHLRVAALVEELAGTILETWKDFDIKRAWTAALVHDDHEMVTGDIPLFHKEAMTDSEKQVLKELEIGAVESLAKKFPQTINGYNYQKLLLDTILKDSREARVLSYLDKLDAYCEANHELLAGNFSALFPVRDYPLRIADLQTKYRDIAPLFERKEIPLLNIHLRADPRCIKYERYAHFGKGHTAESIRKESDILFYDDWRSVVVRRLGKQGHQWLVAKTEPAVAELPREEIKSQPLKLALVS